MKLFARRHNRQVAVFDEYGRLRAIFADADDDMECVPATSSARTDDLPLCSFCGAPMEHGAAPGVVVCDHCNAMRLYDAQ